MRSSFTKTLAIATALAAVLSFSAPDSSIAATTRAPKRPAPAQAAPKDDRVPFEQVVRAFRRMLNALAGQAETNDGADISLPKP